MTQHSALSTQHSVRTRLINLYGAPSSGKSVKMLQLATHAKLMGQFCEICPEVAKEYVIREINVTATVQEEITREQFRRLMHYAGYVDYLITDAPVLIGAFYAEDHQYAERAAILEMARGFQRALEERAQEVNVYMTRDHPFVQHGRYQTEEHALRIERDMLAFVKRHHEIEHLLEFKSTVEVAGLWGKLQR